MRRDATWISQARGLSGTPFAAATASPPRCSASCTASSQAAKSRNRRTTAPSTCGASSRSRCWVRGVAVGGGITASLWAAPLITCRTSIAMFSGVPPRPGRGGRLGGDLVGALGALDVDDPVAGEELLRLGEHAVGDRLAVLPGAHALGLVRARPGPRRRPARPASPSFFAKPIMNSMCALMSSCGQLAIWYGPLPGCSSSACTSWSTPLVL